MERKGREEGGIQGDGRMENEQEVVKGSSRWVGLFSFLLYSP